MQSLRIAVVDDEASARQILLGFLDTYASEHGVSFDVHTFGDGAAILEGYRPIYDVIFLDVKMVAVDGMRTAEQIREVDSEVQLVFVTNLAQYAIKGYRVRALSFLLKPITYFSFAEEMSRIFRTISSRQTESVLVGKGTNVHRFAVPDILYVESKKHQNIVHTVSDVVSYTGTLRDLETQLADLGFFRINSYYLANLRHVVSVSGNDARMSNGDYLRISRARKKDFMSALTDFLGGPVL